MRHHARLFFWGTVAFGIAALGGCGSTPAPACPFAETVQPGIVQVSPAWKATGVPTSGTLVYASSGRSTDIELTSGTASIATQPTSVPSPLPSGAATPAPPGLWFYYAVSYASLHPRTVYSVSAQETMTTGCSSSQPTTLDVGKFTTK